MVALNYQLYYRDFKAKFFLWGIVFLMYPEILVSSKFRDTIYPSLTCFKNYITVARYISEGKWRIEPNLLGEKLRGEDTE